jgi:putative restriction endonuclease
VGIGGFGLFARFARLPMWRVCEVFGESNGVHDERALRDRLARLSGNPWVRTDNDRMIGCVSITEPIFFPPDEWVPVPRDWHRNIVSGRAYDLTRGEGATLWRSCLERAERQAVPWVHEGLERARHGKPQLIQPRLGQGAFRIAVLDAYGQACAVTTEHSLPVLEAAHIRPWGMGGEHAIRNGIPLRRDLHRLFDLGYVTIRPNHRLAVSDALRDDYENGRTYYELETGESCSRRTWPITPTPDYSTGTDRASFGREVDAG